MSYTKKCTLSVINTRIYPGTELRMDFSIEARRKLDLLAYFYEACALPVMFVSTKTNITVLVSEYCPFGTVLTLQLARDNVQRCVGLNARQAYCLQHLLVFMSYAH